MSARRRVVSGCVCSSGEGRCGRLCKGLGDVLADFCVFAGVQPVLEHLVHC